MTAVYRFGRFELRPATRQLLVDQQPVVLGARAFDVLLALIERRDRLVAKNELLDLVWPGVVVEENNLMVQVSALRKALGPEAIATIPGRGYRFAAALIDSDPEVPPAPEPVVEMAPELELPGPTGASVQGNGRRWLTAGMLALGLAGVVAWQVPQLRRAPSPTRPPAFSVAAMPFAGASASADDELFVRGFTDDLLMGMGKSQFIKLTAGRRVLDFKDRKDTRGIGQELNVRYLIDGEVRATGGDMLVTAHLVEAESGIALWTHQLPVNATSSAEARSVQAKTLGLLLRRAVYENELRRAVANPVPGSAVDLFLQGDAAMRAPGPIEQKQAAARKYFDAALRIDPGFVPALGVLSSILDDVLLNDLDADRATLARTIDEQDRISSRLVEIGEASPGAWYQRAQALMWLGRYDQALTANAKARSLHEVPDAAAVSQQSWIMLALDRPEEALAVAARAIEISPLDRTGQEGFAIRMLCESTFLLGRYEEALTACEKSAARDDWWLDHAWLAAGYAQLGDASRASAAKAALLKKKPGFTIEKFRTVNVGNAGFQQRTEAHLFAGLRKAGIPESSSVPTFEVLANASS